MSVPLTEDDKHVQAMVANLTAGYLAGGLFEGDAYTSALAMANRIFNIRVVPPLPGFRSYLPHLHLSIKDKPHGYKAQERNPPDP